MSGPCQDSAATFRLVINILLCVSAICAVAFAQIAQEKNAPRRWLSLDYGSGACKWTSPNYDVDNVAKYFSTLLVGYPGGTKRMIYLQIEALTAMAFNDEWTSYPSNHPNRAFTKANYPHHEGTWGWGNGINQVIMVLRNPRYSFIEYHDVLHDIDYAGDANTAFENSVNLYITRPSVDSWIQWRDLRIQAEVNWYGWFIDYWMEGGIMRDIATHKPTTLELFKKQLVIPGPYFETGKAYAEIIGSEDVTPTYDPHCLNDMLDGSCKPMLVVSAEDLFTPVTGPGITLQLAQALKGKQGIDVISLEASPCIWDELIVKKKGLRTMRARTGTSEILFKFKLEHFNAMITELKRLKNKYSAPEWSSKKTAQLVVSNVEAYIIDINNQIATGNYV